ncbi:MAG: hypothetical protein AAGC55_03210 [Myxococcota bacterium]
MTAFADQSMSFEQAIDCVRTPFQIALQPNRVEIWERGAQQVAEVATQYADARDIALMILPQLEQVEVGDERD